MRRSRPIHKDQSFRRNARDLSNLLGRRWARNADPTPNAVHLRTRQTRNPLGELVILEPVGVHPLLKVHGVHCALYARSPQARCAAHDVAGYSRQAHIAAMTRTKDRPRHYLRQWRKFRGYTLEQVAERIGMTHQNLGKIERGKVPYNETLLDILADIYRTDKGSLIMRDPTMPDAFWSIYDQLTQPQRVRLVETATEVLRRTGTDG